MYDLSIIIVTYNSERDIKICLDSIINKTKGISYEIIVVDNSSNDKTFGVITEYSDKYKNIKVILSTNDGFNAGNNKGIRISKGKYIALLNPDTILLNDAFSIIIYNMKQIKNVGACGPALYTKENELNQSHISFPSLRDTLLRSFKFISDNFFLPNINKKKMNVQSPSGAAFVFNRRIVDLIGYMDERYFLYYDETDYAYHINKLGLKSFLFSEAKIIHLQGQSTQSMSDFSKRVFLESYVKYLKKNISYLEARLMTLVKILEYRVKLIIINIIKKDLLTRVDGCKEELQFYITVNKKIKR